MPEDSRSASGVSDERGSSRPLLVLGSLAILAVVALAGVYAIYQAQSGGEIALSQDGVTIHFDSGDTLADLIDRAMVDEESRRDVATLLAPHDFYHIQDVRWTNRLREIEVKPEVSKSVRELLYDLKGPFAPPGTLAGADDRLYAALTELDDVLKTFEPDKADAPANPFFTKIWVDQLDRQGVFSDRLFRATVTMVEAPHEHQQGRHIIYVCAGSDLRDRNVTLSLNEPNRPPSIISAVTKVNSLRFDCNKATQTMPHFLARETVLMGLAREGFAQFFGPGGEEVPLPARVQSKFQVAPRNYVPIEPVEDQLVEREAE